METIGSQLEFLRKNKLSEMPLSMIDPSIIELLKSQTGIDATDPKF